MSSAGSLLSARSSQKSRPRVRLGGRWTPAIALTIHVKISATGATIPRSINAAARRCQKPTT